MLIGYMRRAATEDGAVMDAQLQALLGAGVEANDVFADSPPGRGAEPAGLARAREFIKPGDCLVIWRLDRIGLSLTNLLATVIDLGQRRIGFRSLTEHLDTTSPHGEFLGHVFGALAQCEQSVMQEHVQATLAARRPGRRGGRPAAIDRQTFSAVTASLEAGATKAAVCRHFGIKRTTLIDTLARSGWSRGTKEAGS